MGADMVTAALKEGALFFTALALMAVIVVAVLVFLCGIGAALLLVFTDARSFDPALHLLTTVGAAVVGVLACSFWPWVWD